MGRTPGRLLRLGGAATIAAALAFVAVPFVVHAHPAEGEAPQATGTSVQGRHPVQARDRVPARHPVVTWGAAMEPLAETLTDATVRNIVHTSVGGWNPRVRLSNTFGDRAVTFDRVYLGVQRTGASLVPGSNRSLTFGGRRSVTIPAGTQMLSDPLAATVPAGEDLAISLHVRGSSGALTGHRLAMGETYLADGDVAGATSGDAFTGEASHWYWVTGVVVGQVPSVHTVAILGDSITDGVGSTPGEDRRWPDDLERRLFGAPGVERFGVLNVGIGGNRVLLDTSGSTTATGSAGADTASASASGSPSALHRFGRDVLDRPGVDTVILLDGINDILRGLATSPDQLIAAYRDLITRAHAAGTCVLGGTLTPFKGAAGYTPAKEDVRVAVNEFIRHGRGFDGVIDFDRAVRDPDDPARLDAAYDGGGHLHLNDAGYEAMAAAVDLGMLSCHRRPADIYRGDRHGTDPM